MSSESAPIAILGIGGTGRSHRLAEWTETVRRATGASPRVIDARTQVAEGDDLLVDAVTACHEDQLPIAIDNVDSCAPEVVGRIADLTAALRGTLAVTTTPHHGCPELDRLIDLIAAAGQVVHTTLLGATELLDLIEAASPGTVAPDVALRIGQAVGGSTALAIDAIETDWVGNLDDRSSALDTLVERRVRRSGGAVRVAVEFAALGAPFDVAIKLAQDDPVSNQTTSPHRGGSRADIEPLVLASGLFNGGELIALVSTVTAANMTSATRRERSAQIISGARHLNPTVRAGLVRAATADATSNEDRVAEAIAAFRLGDGDAMGLVAQLTDDSDTAALVRFGTDMRMMRWADAGQRVITTTRLSALAGLSQAFNGDVFASDFEPGEPNELLPAREWATCHQAIVQFAAGDLSGAIGLASQAVDDATHGASNATLGITPAAIGALFSLGAGDPSHASGLLELAIQHDIGGPGEHRFHRFLQAISTMQTGDYAGALDAVRAGDNDRWPHRDRLMLATIDVALARRSGDTQRLRDGWRRAAPLLARGNVSWLFTDPLVELMSAGARLGDHRQVRALHHQLTEQLRGLPPNGPGSTWAVWSDLQLAVATEAWDSLPTAEGVSGGDDARSRARQTAVRAWATIGTRSPDVALVHEAARQLAVVDDAWEASRLLGQAALDQADSTQARSLLEAARLLVAAPSTGEDGLIAAGLSEREADVARLVVDGVTHRDIGAQLFISPKTVEHHVAKIRQRLGASTRAEMIAAIRDLLGTST